MTKPIKKFAEWLKERDPKLAETSTSTADVAMFVQRAIPMIRRNNKIPPVADEEDTKKEKN